MLPMLREVKLVRRPSDSMQSSVIHSISSSRHVRLFRLPGSAFTKLWMTSGSTHSLSSLLRLRMPSRSLSVMSV
eukprot:scaffold113216_cov48-Prasinocladus_malaysianus.AAC.2